MTTPGDNKVSCNPLDIYRVMIRCHLVSTAIHQHTLLFLLSDNVESDSMVLELFADIVQNKYMYCICLPPAAMRYCWEGVLLTGEAEAVVDGLGVGGLYRGGARVRPGLPRYQVV